MSTKGKSTPAERRAALMAADVTADSVLNALQIELGIETDQELAEFAGVSKATVSTWRSRNSIPFEFVVFLSLSGLIDLNYVLTRRGRLSGFLRPSETLDDPTLLRELEEVALAEVAPVVLDKADIARAASDLVDRRQFYLEFLQQHHASDRSGILAGRYVSFAVDLLSQRKQTILQQRARLRKK